MVANRGRAFFGVCDLVLHTLFYFGGKENDKEDCGIIASTLYVDMPIGMQQGRNKLRYIK